MTSCVYIEDREACFCAQTGRPVAAAWVSDHALVVVDADSIINLHYFSLDLDDENRNLLPAPVHIYSRLNELQQICTNIYDTQANVEQIIIIFI